MKEIPSILHQQDGLLNESLTTVVKANGTRVGARPPILADEWH